MKIALLAIMLLISTTKSNTSITVNSKTIHQPVSRFVGKWHWTPDKSEVFSLDIKQVGNKLVGSYCDVFDYGKKMDCTDGEDRSFTIPIPHTNSVVTAFISTYSNAQGKVQLTISGNKLIWKVIKRPIGINYCPSVAVMKRG